MTNNIPIIVDQVLAEMSKQEYGMMLPGKIPQKMQDKTRASSEGGWHPWKAIQSTVSAQELKELEALVGVPLPKSFQEFLQYKHFYELMGPQGEAVRFYRHPIYHWKEEFKRFYGYDWVQEDLLANKYIPFADHYDWGFLCFDANEKVEDNEYPIVMIDHEMLGEVDSYSHFSDNFRELLQDYFTY